MAHNITSKDSIAYAGETPWHGIGHRLDDLQVPAEMLKRAGLEWTVSTTPLFTPTPTGQPMIAVHDFVGIRRNDTADILGVASKGYKILQNAQAFEIVDALVSEGKATVEVAGSIREGRMAWALSKLPDEFEVVRGDVVRPYFLLAWGHDGKHGVAGVLTPIRVVCNNTLTAALGKKWSQNATIFFRHFGDLKVRVTEAQKALGIVKRQIEEVKVSYQLLAATAEVDVRGYFSSLFPSPVAGQDETPDAFDNRMADWRDTHNRLVQSFESGAGNDLPGVRGTAWAAYNAVTEYLDHGYPTLKSGAVSAARQQSVLFGQKAQVKAQALRSALALAG